MNSAALLELVWDQRYNSPDQYSFSTISKIVEYRYFPYPVDGGRLSITDRQKR